MPNVFPFLYGITDSTLMPGSTLNTKVEAALRAGLTLLQYRDKSRDAEKRKREALALQKLCRHYNATFIINDDVELAAAIGADGVHLGLDDESIENARSALGTHAIIGATCHNQPELAAKAIASGANYIAFGRFYHSNTKAGAPQANLQVLQDAKKLFRVPVVGIGGITANNASDIWRAGANCVAVCHSLFGVEDPGKAVRDFTLTYNNLFKDRDQYE